MSRSVLIAVVLAVVPAAAAHAAPATRTAGLRADLRASVKHVAQVLDGKNVRHRLVHEHLDGMFLERDGRDRFMLNLISGVRGAGILDAKVRRLNWRIVELDPDYGYAEVAAKLCGRWYVWIPRCFETRLRWRHVDESWYLLPPESVELEPKEDGRVRGRAQRRGGAAGGGGAGGARGGGAARQGGGAAGGGGLGGPARR